jgi:hypothetical protein
MIMTHEQTVTIQQMKEALAANANSKLPLKITAGNGENRVLYVRGFADQEKNIVLISENAYTLALRILEVKEIRTLEFARENSEGQWTVLHARAWKKSAKTQR